MAWDFETDPEYQKVLDWADEFVREEVEPLDLAFPHQQFVPLEGKRRDAIDPLKEEVRRRGLWATHLGPELGGQGYGQLKLALLNEILGRSQWAPIVFGCQAPDTGNAEIIAHYGTEEQKTKYLMPLLGGELFSCYSMTEPHAGADPTLFRTSAVRDGDDWVINGQKFFSSNASTAAFLIVMVVTNPEVSAYQGMSMFLVPTDTPGVNIVRNIGLYGEPEGQGSHALIHYDNVRVPAEALLGGEGQAFVIAQTRLGGGRIHHAMRTIGMSQRALDMMCERALSRQTQGSRLSDKQFVQGYIADSYAQLLQFRLMVLYTAWEIDKYNDYKKVRKDIAAVKVAMPTVLHDIAWRAMQVHGALGVTNEMPFLAMVTGAAVMGLADGPTEVHKTTVAKQVLRDYQPTSDTWPTEWEPRKREAARAKYADYLEIEVGESVTEEEIDTARLADWMDGAALPGKGEPLVASFLSGGTQNVIYKIRRGDNVCVLRMPPTSAPTDRDKGILREWRIIEALDGTEVPHTAAVGVCADGSVLGRPFYLMGFVDGWSPMDQHGKWPDPFDGDMAARAGLSYQLAEGIALLSKVDWRAKGLQDLGRPDGFHERQVDRWTAFFERIKGREIDGLDAATDWLRTHRPLDFVPGLMHGDYQFANVMYRHGAPARMAAIVDWEMGTVGDPKLDLGWMVQGWPEDTDAPGSSEMSYVDMRGMPSRDDVVEHYAAVSGRQVDDLDYYLVLAKWKLAIVLEQGFQRAGDNEKLLAYGPVITSLMQSAADLAESSDYR